MLGVSLKGVKQMKKEKGSIVVEASLVFPIVIMVMLAFSILIRYFMVYETIQHGMYETTREVGAYYYVYSLSGVEDCHNQFSDEKGKAEGNLDMLAEPINQTINTITIIGEKLNSTGQIAGELANDPSTFSMDKVSQVESNINTLVDSAGKLKQNLGDSKAALELIAANPLETLTYVIKLGVGEAFDWAVDSGMNLIARALLSKHIPGGDLDRYAAFYGIEDLNTAMVWNAGMSGDVEMLVTYKFTIRLFGGYTYQVIQRTVTKGWGRGV